ncbi:MAG: putative F420-dependent oxidoreductase [Frankiales bacterium]|nr:putative F420-dependent oxidoreductase [Frankiales bacterium]
MFLGLHISAFNYDGGVDQLGLTLSGIAKTAETAGFRDLTVMDHVFQIAMVGPHDDPMLEAYTALGYLAGVTSTIRLGTVVTSAVYRPPGLLIKSVTTLDVLSGGRAFFGVGAAWNEQESLGLGLPFPPTAERFERLEELLQIAKQMWSEDGGPYSGVHSQLAATVNSPQSIQRPHPPIMVGGSGEKKTLRLVAKYADACNIFAGPDAGRKLAVLREHCEREDRDYDHIEKTSMVRGDPSDLPALLAQLRELHEAGFEGVYLTMVKYDDLAGIQALGTVAGQVATW